MSTDIRIALVYQQAGGSDALRAALANAGVTVAAESRAEAIDAAALMAADVDAVVVNLDPELEDLLDEVMERLDGFPQPVIYNDPEASSDLSGWDRARWLRHLSAKVKGGGSLVPPPPPGAKAIPVPAPRPVEPVRPEVAGSAQPPEAAAPPPAAELTPAPAMDVEAALPADQIDLLFVAAEASVSVPLAADSPGQEPTLDLDALFESPPAGPEGEQNAERETLAVASDGDLDALFVAPAASDGGLDQDKLALADLDALFAEEESRPAPAEPEPIGERQVDEGESEVDLSALLADFSLEDHLPSGGAAAEPVAPLAAEDAAGDRDMELSSFDPRLAAPADPKPSKDDVLSDLTDLDSLFAEAVDEGEVPPRSRESVADIEIDALELGTVDLEFEPMDVGLPDAPDAPGQAPPNEESIAVADFDFGFDLEPMTGEESATDSADLAVTDPLDALFAPSAAAAHGQAEIALPDLDRLFVLGGSIGGPEAMKAFLARLPAGVPAAFVIAQHMGAEFLPMMASQLDAATALSVRCPKPGERLRHGEAIVAPSDQRLKIDAGGHVDLQPSTGDSPYSPSIDQLVTDAIERFGDRATLILFSGMGNDALQGAQQLIAIGGQVWVQERSSCVVATMIDAVKTQGLVRFEGSPVQLADRVLEVLS
jgi:two-component system chemotaxis response regulator CheB/chemosensory pili system protein ChpB (putative protein-glutamate methylesterase)